MYRSAGCYGLGTQHARVPGNLEICTRQVVNRFPREDVERGHPESDDLAACNISARVRVSWGSAAILNSYAEVVVARWRDGVDG